MSVSIVLIAILLAAQQAAGWIGHHGNAYDCSEKERPQGDWSLAHQTWCCKVASIACPTTPTTTTLPFDCKEEFYEWQDLWSPGKKAWCCDHFGLGCPKTTTSIPYACTAGLGSWETEWSVGKKAWCCEHEHVGCPTTAHTTTPAFAGASTSSPTHFDCDANFDDWGNTWGAHKRAWCCEFHKRGCPTLSPALAI